MAHCWVLQPGLHGYVWMTVSSQSRHRLFAGEMMWWPSDLAAASMASAGVADRRALCCDPWRDHEMTAHRASTARALLLAATRTRLR